MKIKLFLIALVCILSSWTGQTKSEVVLLLGQDSECLKKGIDVPVTIKLTDEVYKTSQPILNGIGIVLTKKDTLAPVTGRWHYLKYTGRVATKNSEVNISVSLRDRRTEKVTHLYTETYFSCGN